MADKVEAKIELDDTKSDNLVFKINLQFEICRHELY